MPRYRARQAVFAAAVASALVAGTVPAFAAAGASDGAASASVGGRRAAVGLVTGTVVNGKGDPVVGALVNVLRPTEVPERGIIPADTPRRTWTGDDGSFSVQQSGAGYLVQICVPEPTDKTACKETARGAGFVITYVGPVGVTDSWVTQNSLFAGVAADRDLGEVTVMPQGFISGHFDNAPAFQPLQLLRLNDTVAYNESFDDNGDFTLRGLAPGRYRLSAGGNGFLPWRSKVLTVVAHQTTVVDGALRLGGVITGTMTNRGEPVPFTDVFIKTGGHIVAAATTDQDGVYSASGFAPGDYRVGITYYGTDFLHQAAKVTIAQPNAHVTQDLAVHRGATVTVSLRSHGKPATDVLDELRNSDGTPILGFTADGNGGLRYPGLSRGTYTFVASDGDRYARRTFTVDSLGRTSLGRVELSHPTFTLSGTTAPNAVVEAFTGDQCPPDGPDQPGSFHFISDRADGAGHYELTGLVPGRYMLGSDGWPNNFVPQCWKGVRLTGDTVMDLPLEVGGTVSGRLVYASNAQPTITNLSYELIYPQGSPGQPTDEHPSRAKSIGATGAFSIDALGADTVTGRLSQGAFDDQINDEEFFVIFPYQDFTPYFLTTDEQQVQVGPGLDVDLGDVPVRLRGTVGTSAPAVRRG